jgi:hypothetical protein
MIFGETGKTIEEEVLGEVKEGGQNVPIGAEAPEASEMWGKEKDFFNKEHHFETVKKIQPFADPTAPVERPFPFQVKKEIAKKLGGLSDKQLRYYTSVDYPPLDHHRDRKVDAFIELDLGGGDCVRVTWDITTKEDTGDKIADIPFSWDSRGTSSVDQEDRDVWNNQVKIISELSARILQAKAMRAKGIVPNLNEFEIEESARMRSQNIEKQAIQLQRQNKRKEIRRSRSQSRSFIGR